MTAVLHSPLLRVIALCVLLWHALAPALAQAMPRRVVSIPVEICTFAGLGHGPALQIVLDDGQAAVTSPCPWCTLTGLLALPPASSVELSLPEMRLQAAPARNLLPAEPPLASLPASRGPPTLSP